MNRVFFAATVAVVLSVVATEARAELLAVGSTGAFRSAFVQKPEGYDQVSRRHIGNANGFKALCDAETESPPDMVFVTRAINDDEAKACDGTDLHGEKVARSSFIFLTGEESPLSALTREEIFLALVPKVPDPNDEMVLIRNPFNTWADINPDLPDIPIKIAGPTPNVYDFSKFVVQTVRHGCKNFPAYKEVEKNDYKGYFRVCGDVRQDGIYKEIGRKFSSKDFIKAQPTALMVAAYLAPPSPKASAKIAAKGFKAVSVDGMMPTPQSIADGSYALGTDLMVYARKDTLGAKPTIEKIIDGLKMVAGRFSLRYFGGR